MIDDSEEYTPTQRIQAHESNAANGKPQNGALHIHTYKHKSHENTIQPLLDFVRIIWNPSMLRHRRTSRCIASSSSVAFLVFLSLLLCDTISFFVTSFGGHVLSTRNTKMSSSRSSSLNAAAEAENDSNSTDIAVPYASISSMPKRTKDAIMETITTTDKNNCITQLEAQQTDEEVVVVVSEALQHFYDTVTQLQLVFGTEAIEIARDDDDIFLNDDNDDDAIPVINSLIFSINNNDSEYVLVVIGEQDRVNVKALEVALQQRSGFLVNGPVGLAPSSRLQEICGFAPGTIPPIGLSPEPMMTVIDESLLTALQPETVVKGGGGLKDQSCLLSIEVLLQHQQLSGRVLVAAVAETVDTNELQQRVNGVDSVIITTETNVPNESLPRPKPYFAVEPPDDDIAARVLEDEDDMTAGNVLQPVAVSVVGRIAGVRRMARELAFCDFVPPGVVVLSKDNDDDDDLWPWRNPVSGEPMGVQLIAGKTLCQTTGSDEAIRRLQKGQLVLVHGRTNVRSRDSLRNSIDKRILDIVVHSYQLLQEETTKNLFLVEQRQRQVERRRIFAPPAPTVNPESCLRLHDLYSRGDGDAINGDDSTKASATSHTVLVDDMQSVKRFTKDLSTLLTSIHTLKPNEGEGDEPSKLPTLGLVGIDCEWQPSFLLPSSRDPQPVLLLQVCLHTLKRTYLFDLQTLLRPMMPPSQSMDKLEREVSFALGALFESKRLIKVGFQVVHDLRQLAASYPHISTLQFYNAVLESSTLGKKAIRMTRSGDAREATSSLSRLVDQFIGKPLNKQEQCSDWSKRPLSDEQIEYASLDAAVTPIIVEKMVREMDAHLFGVVPQLGRWDNDVSFKKSISSWRFVFVHTTDYNVQRKLKAKRVVGDPLVVSQSWTTGDVPPKLPALPENGSDGPYTDTSGVVQVPSTSVTIRSSRIDDIIDSMIGERVGKSKDKCVAAFLQRPVAMPEGAKLDYPQRSGYVEFRDGVALFVNMPSTPGGRFQPRSYPNEWLNDGRILTWFLRENDWKHGTSDLAKKLVSGSNVIVTLFVRMGTNGAFLCCGRCRVEPDLLNIGIVNGDTPPDALIVPDNWTLVKLHLILLDWSKLRSSTDFQALLYPLGCIVPE
jgi:prolyl-tRNA editing enzyme YbaK/EbsC (Cys-tRNA(Pro) deacylase)